MMAPDTEADGIKQLTKRTTGGEAYLRRPEVEAQISKLLSFEPSRILELLNVKQRENDGYLFDETIVYLIRQHTHDRPFGEDLFQELHWRILKLLKKFSANFRNRTDFEDFVQQTEYLILRKILDLQSDAGDFLQVNFGLFVIKTAKVVWQGELAKIVREKENLTISREDEEDAVHQLENRISADTAATDDILILREGIAKLPPRLQLVAGLLSAGWPIESQDENEPTISRQLQVSSRTIRNWLKEARSILSDYQGAGR